MIVIDASAVLELLLRTARGWRVELRALAPDEQLAAPHLLDIEIAQALRRLTQLREISASRARDALMDHGSLFIRRVEHKELLGRIWELRNNLTAYDASYVTLAEAFNVPLLTCDGKLARAQGHEARIELVE